jgi:hypothetical protein
MKVFISGSIGIRTLNEQAVYCLDAIMNSRHTVLIGDAFGADKAVQQYLFQRDYHPVTVYYSGDKVRNNIGSWQMKQISNDQHLKGKSRYQLKDAAMARDADCGLMIWNGKSRGTKYNIENMTGLGKPFTVVENSVF